MLATTQQAVFEIEKRAYKDLKAILNIDQQF